MSLDLYLVYVSAVIVLCLTPGPNSLLALTNGAKYGPQRAFASTLGCASGLFLLIAVCLTGLGVLVATSETAFTVLKVLGGTYLVWLGVVLIRSKSVLEDVGSFSYPGTPPGYIGLYGQGLLVVLGNPKVLLFFTAFLPQFYSPAGSYWTQVAILAGTFVLVEIVLEVCLASLSAKIGSLLRRSRVSRLVSCISGGLFVAAGLFMLASERPK